MKTLLVALTAFAVATPTLAQSQADVKIQVARDAYAADVALNAQYRATMAVMAKDDAVRNADLKQGIEKPDGDPTYQAALLASQRAWLAYRDAECRLAGFEYRGGSSESLAGGLCVVTLTKARTAELAQIQKSLGNR